MFVINQIVIDESFEQQYIEAAVYLISKINAAILLGSNSRGVNVR